VPWWFWVLLWVALLVCSAAAAVGAGFWLVRKALRAVRDAGESLGRVAAPSGFAERAAARSEDSSTAAAFPDPGGAVFSDPDEMRRAYAEGKAARQEARRRRRIARRAQRGQAQSLRDLELL
jgi:hypothetical protein